MLYCGAAKADITPPEELLPIKATGKRPEITAIADKQFVRAIFIKNNDLSFLFLSFDLTSPPHATEWCNAITTRFGIPRECIMYIGTHAHAAVFIPAQYDADSQDGQVFRAIEAKYFSGLMQAVEEAIASARPARMGIGYGTSNININRNRIYCQYNQSGDMVREYCALGWRPDGPSDKTVAVIKFESPEGKVVAQLINYAVHNVGMHGNSAGPRDGMALSSDIGGLCSQYMEEAFPGSVAMWTSGAAGDQNPLLMTQLYYLDYRDGSQIRVEYTKASGEKARSIRGGGYELTLAEASIHYYDVLGISRSIKCLEDDIPISATIRQSRTPGLKIDSPVEEKYNGVRSIYPIFNQYNYGLDYDNTYNIDLRIVKLGSTVVIGMNGELYTTIGQLLKSVSPYKNTIIITHDRPDSDNSVGYIYDDEGCSLGGNGGLYRYRSRLAPGFVPSELCRILLNTLKEMDE